MAFLEAYILKFEAQNVMIAPMNQIFHTFTDKKYFSVQKVFLHSKSKTLQIIWPLGVSVSLRTFIKSNIFPEEISFNFAEQEESVESPQEKHYFTTKRGHFYFQSGTKQSFNTIFSRLRRFIPKEMHVQQESAFQLHNVNPCKWIDVLHQNEHWTHTCGCCSCEILPPFLFPVSDKTVFQHHLFQT